jgi:nucleoside-diphosphate-sugar epimerase
MAVILLTGANGFVGRALCAHWAHEGPTLRPVLRQPDPARPDAVTMDISPHSDWTPHLVGVDCVVHLAARVHMLGDTAHDPLAAYRSANVAATLQLARQAQAAGVRRFVFLSSIKVSGEATHGRPFCARDAPDPQDPYGISKWEAEQGLTQIALETGLEVVIIRPPLVYGPGVKANFLQLMRLVARGWPLPLGSVHNRRSMVYVGNLVDLIVRCCHHPEAPGQTLLVSDGVDVSSAELVAALAQAMGRRSPLFSCPPALLQAGARVLGKRALAERLLGSLQVDMTATQQRLDWQPPFGFKDGIAATVASWKAQA